MLDLIIVSFKRICVMNVFKYFRPNIYFEKAVRYNELYFSETHELNDPHDLNATYFFEDDPESWTKLLCLSEKGSAWSIDLHVNPECKHLAKRLNDLFRNIEFESSDSIKTVVENKAKELEEIFVAALWEGSPTASTFSFTSKSPPKARAEMCRFELTALLGRGHNQLFYSLSFSKRALEPMMWAHYADGFKGCVLIYGATDNKLSVKHHPLAREAYPYPLLPVTYINGDKRISILECAVSGSTKKVAALLQKNSGWDYEKEVRLLTMEEIDNKFQAILPKVPVNNRQKILYHSANDLVGVIFGPRCDEKYKKKIETIIRDNRFYQGQKSFFSLGTTLTNDGVVKVTEAARCICISQSDGRSPISEDALENLLLSLGIS
ncbi:DUF2971 domain-containing protein [Pseudomonas lactis]|uniref:DUF2971 domain-containing protein n=4 Tax=Pseudomonas TaxID=286 RepID=A0ABS9FQN3_9PSED|nr:DUF2971 domain-containing protein [Pseudomonas lactis]MCF5370928.1 DUF2971 domain-containing protein [Pseudomonas sp. PA-4-8C]MCF5008336.1 DUF2971 domain-containing protein [Pseudomonas lactis]MCF5015900.1 DUF2971 domain-containing protein [Pseudomonas lactis]MCF5036460.1 DUF2971 domain-containing protein [Pseudomonas lactis]